MLKTEGYENSELFMALTPKNGVKASKLYSYKPIDGTGDFVWTRALTAYRMNQEGVLELMGTNVPRVDYSNTCPELLMEKSSENLVLYSEDFSNAAWVKIDTTITSNDIAAPNGLITGDKVSLNVGTSSKGIAQTISIATTQNRTFSIYAKQGTHRYIQLQIDGTNSFCNFDLQTGTKGTPNLCTSDIKLVNGWYRCEINYTDDNITPIVWAVDSLISGISPNTSSTGNFYLWGCQSEISEYATSYMPTTTTSVTRPKDVAYNTANVFLDSAWSIVMRVRLNDIGTSSDEPLISLNDGTSDTYFSIYTDSNPKLHFQWDNSLDIDVFDTDDLANGIYNIGVSYDDATADYIIVVNGALEFAGTLVVNPPGVFSGFTRMDLGSVFGIGSMDKDGIIGVQYYDSALTQTDLINLTTT